MADYSAMGAGMMGGAGVGGLWSAFNQKNPYDAAKGYYDKIPGMLQNTYNPYIQNGNNAMGQLNGQNNQLMTNLGPLEAQNMRNINDPTSVMNQIGSGYQASPGFKWQMGQGMNAANNAAAAGGMQGSPQHQQQAATMATGLANQDYYNYMSKGLDQYNRGMQGATGLYGLGYQGLNHMNDQGYNASNELASGLGSTWMNQGSAAMSAQQAQNQGQNQMWGDLMSTGAKLAMM